MVDIGHASEAEFRNWIDTDYRAEEAFNALELDIYQAVFDKIDAFSIVPVGVEIALDAEQDSAAVVTRVNDYFNTR